MKITQIDSIAAKSPLVLVDDCDENLLMLQCMLQWGGFNNLHSFQEPTDALEAIASIDPHLIIFDIASRKLDGLEFLERIQRSIPDGTFVPILVHTSDLTPDAKIRALDLGASDFLDKPADSIEIQMRVRNMLRTRQLQDDLQQQNFVLEARILERSKHLDTARREAVEVLANACEYRDDNTGQHTRRVGSLSADIAMELGLAEDFVESLRLVAPLHDVGKIAIPDNILHKPARLTDEEFVIMKSHVTIGAQLLGQNTSPLLLLASEVARYHHERWDGKGYNVGLAGRMIPISARIVSVADTFDAMTNDRPYRRAGSVFQALQEIRANAGTQFDPEVVAALERLMQRSAPAFAQAA